MAHAILFLRRELGGRPLRGSVDEHRVVAEAVVATRPLGDGAIPAAERDQRCRIVGASQRDDGAVEVRRALVARYALERLQQLIDILRIGAIDPCVARRMNAMSTHARPLARRHLSASAAVVVVGGLVLGMSNTAVTPPSAAPAVPVAKSSLCSSPGSRKWT